MLDDCGGLEALNLLLLLLSTACLLLLLYYDAIMVVMMLMLMGIAVVVVEAGRGRCSGGSGGSLGQATAGNTLLAAAYLRVVVHGELMLCRHRCRLLVLMVGLGLSLLDL